LNGFDANQGIKQQGLSAGEWQQPDAPLDPPSLMQVVGSSIGQIDDKLPMLRCIS